MERIFIGTEEPRERREGLIPSMLRDIADVIIYRHYIYFALVSMFKVRYQRSVLGLFWTLLNPLMSLAILSIVFGNIIGQNIPNYHIYLFCGVVPFSFFQQTVMGCSKSLIVSESAVKQSCMPLIVYPIITLCFQIVEMLCTLVGVFLILLFMGIELSLPLVLLPVHIVLLAVFSFGLALIAMTLTTYFRDFEHFLSVFFRGLYFISPVLLTPKMLGKYSVLMTINPVTYYLNLFRSGIYYGQWPDTTSWGVSIGFAIAAFAVGYVNYKLFEKKYVFQM